MNTTRRHPNTRTSIAAWAGVAYPPALAISTLVQRLKNRTAYAVRREHTGTYVPTRMRGHRWSPSYFAVSCDDVPLSIIKQYIDSQARPL